MRITFCVDVGYFDGQYCAIATSEILNTTGASATASLEDTIIAAIRASLFQRDGKVLVRIDNEVKGEK